VQAAQCVVLEDSGPGITAATAAGLKCIAVPTIFTRHHDLAHADLIVSSLEAVTLETLNGLV
jgi:beta-phosphoglucomutase-like phosphatase (HAD superfamily)